MEKSFLPMSQKKSASNKKVGSLNAPPAVVTERDKIGRTKMAENGKGKKMQGEVLQCPAFKNKPVGEIGGKETSYGSSMPGFHLNSRRSVALEFKKVVKTVSASDLNEMDQEVENGCKFSRKNDDNYSMSLQSQDKPCAFHSKLKSPAPPAHEHNRQTSLKKLSTHLPQIARDVFTSKKGTVKSLSSNIKSTSCSSEINSTAEDVSPIYHELDPIDADDPQHTYQSIIEIREELEKLKSNDVETLSNPGQIQPSAFYPTIPGNDEKHKQAKQSIFSKLWQPRRSHKSSAKDKFSTTSSIKPYSDIYFDELILPCSTNEQNSPVLLTFLPGSRSQSSSKSLQGSRSQPGSANLEKTGSSASIKTGRVFTFEDIDIQSDISPSNSDVFSSSNVDELSPRHISSENSKGRKHNNYASLIFPPPKKTSIDDVQSTKLSTENRALDLNSVKDRSKLPMCSLSRPVGKFPAACILPTSSTLPAKLCPNREFILSLTADRRFEKSKTLKHTQISTSQTTSNLSALSCNKRQFATSSVSFPTSLLSGTSRPASVESLLSEENNLSGSDSPLLQHSPLHRSPFSSPSCGIRMAEMRASRRKSDSKSPSPEPLELTPPPVFPVSQAVKETNLIQKQDAVSQTLKSPTRISGRSPNRYMHTIIEEEQSNEQILTVNINPNGSDKNCSIRMEKLSRNHNHKENYDVAGGRSRKITACVENDDGKIRQRLSRVSDDGIDQHSNGLTTEIKLSNNLCPASESKLGSPSYASGDTLKMHKDSAGNATEARVCSSSDIIKNIIYSSWDEKIAVSTEDCNSVFVDSKTESLQPNLNVDPATDSSKAGSKESRLRQPKLTNGASMDSHRDRLATSHSKISSNSKNLSQCIKKKASECRPLPASRQFIAEATSVDIMQDSSEPIVKQAAIKCIKPFGKCAGTVSSHQQPQHVRAGHECQPVDCPAPDLKGIDDSHELLPSKSLINQKSCQSSKIRKILPISNAMPICGRNYGSSDDNSSLKHTVNTLNAKSDNLSKGKVSNLLKSGSAQLDLGSSLSSSLTSSSGSMLSVAESESESMIFAFRKDFSVYDGRTKLAKSNQVSDVSKNPEQSLLREKDTGKTVAERSRLVAPKANMSRYRERFEKICSENQEGTSRMDNKKLAKEENNGR